MGGSEQLKQKHWRHLDRRKHHWVQRWWNWSIPFFSIFEVRQDGFWLIPLALHSIMSFFGYSGTILHQHNIKYKQDNFSLLLHLFSFHNMLPSFLPFIMKSCFCFPNHILITIVACRAEIHLQISSITFIHHCKDHHPIINCRVKL